MTSPASLTIEDIVADATAARDSAERAVTALQAELARAQTTLTAAQARLDHWQGVRDSQGAGA